MTSTAEDALGSRWDVVGEHVIHSRVSLPRPVHAGPVLVLVHGLVISSLYMVPTARRLASLYPVLAPDLPGFGRSSKPAAALPIPQLAEALAAWLHTVGLESAVLVGNSLGCQIIADLATRHAGAIHAAVLAGPTMDRHARTAPRQIGRWLLDWTLERPSLAAAHARDYYQAGLRRAWATFRHALRDPIEQKLPALTAPTLVVRGGRDPIVPQAWAEEVTALLPNGTLRVLPRAPHVVNYTTPDRFARCVADFLSRPPVSRPPLPPPPG